MAWQRPQSKGNVPSGVFLFGLPAPFGESPSGKASVFGADIRWFESTLPSQRARPAALVGIASATILSGAAIRAKPFLVRSSSTLLSQRARPAALVGTASATILSGAAIRAKPFLVRSSSTLLSQRARPAALVGIALLAVAATASAQVVHLLCARSSTAR
jgi:hypothetical protein